MISACEISVLLPIVLYCQSCCFKPFINSADTNKIYAHIKAPKLQPVSKYKLDGGTFAVIRELTFGYKYDYRYKIHCLCTPSSFAIPYSHHILVALINFEKSCSETSICHEIMT